MEEKRPAASTSDPTEPDKKDAAMMDTDVIDPCATKEVAMTSLDWCTRSRRLSLLNAVLRVHFSNCAISDLEQECSRILRNAVTSGCKDTLVSLLRHVDDAFLGQRQEDGVGGSGGGGNCDDGGDGDDVVVDRRRRTRLQKLLGLAVEHGHCDIVKVLLAKGADPNCWYRNKPLLHLSLSLGHHDVALLLAEYGADVNVTDSKGETPIFAALSSDSERVNNVIDDLISRGADVNHRSLTGRRPIHSAALTPNAAALARLAEAGCDVSASDGVLGDTPLHLACTRCCHDAVVTLVRHGAPFNVPNDHGETPLRKLLQHATRVTKDFHHHTRMRLARVLVRLGFRLVPPPPLPPAASPVAPPTAHQEDPDLQTQPSSLETSTGSKVSHAASANKTASSANSVAELTEPCASADSTSKSAQETHSPLRKPTQAALPPSHSSSSFVSSSSLDKAIAGQACATASKKNETEEQSGVQHVKNSCGNGADKKNAAAPAVGACSRTGGDGAGGSCSSGFRTFRPLNGRNGRDKVLEAFQSLLGERRGGRRVPGLQQLCRVEIRRHLPAVDFQKRAQELELSLQLRQYLMFLPRLLDDTL